MVEIGWLNDTAGRLPSVITEALDWTNPSAEAATKLLQEQRRALCGAEQQQRVDERQVDAFIVEITGEENVHVPLAKAFCRMLRPSKSGSKDFPSLRSVGRQGRCG